MDYKWVNKIFQLEHELFSSYLIKLADVKNLRQLESAIQMGVEIVISDGEIIRDNETIQSCIIVCYQSQSIKSLKSLLKPQLIAYKRIFKNNLLAVTLESISGNHRISLITEMYQKTLDDCQEESEDEKLEILTKTAKVLHKLSKQVMFYGKIRPECICIKKDKSIILKYMHMVIFNEKFNKNFDLVVSESNRYLSPELILLQECGLDNSIDMVIQKSSYYSFGLLFLKLFNLDFPDVFFKARGKPALDYILGNSLDMAIHILFKTQVMAFMLRRQEFSIIKKCIKPVLESRWNFKQIIRIMEACKQQRIENKGINVLDKAIPPLREVFYNALTQIFKKFSSVRRKIANNKGIKVLQKLKAWVEKKNLKSTLKNAENVYFSTPCKTNEIPAEAGILVFLYFLIKDVKRDEELALQLYNTLSKVDTNLDYKKLFNDVIKSKHEHIKDLLISEMIVQTYHKDWNYLFPESYLNFPLFKPCQKLTQNQIFYAQAREFFNEEIIVEILSEFCENIQLVKSHILEGLNRVYITALMPSLHGLTTYNLNIFIKDYRDNIRDNINDVHKGATLITMFHELSYFLRRCESKTLLESRSKYTPEKNSGYENFKIKGMTEWEIFHSREESGGKSEMKLFGETLSSINEMAGKFLLNGNFSSIDQFKTMFFNENKKPGLRISMLKGMNYVSFTGLRCGVSLKIHP
ncbi:hypothetical protein SteCoe_6271 [Stentor coeruleus]|uniref:Protein kinase domain-containing protein n=1 Tax=Stentor coeruleus TaxID=5963 RepID=A0A1R2CQE8_9CILI|nr:hypothetical protein SteCoe_6271 [Stentor coeruleus]